MLLSLAIVASALAIGGLFVWVSESSTANAICTGNLECTLTGPAAKQAAENTANVGLAIGILGALSAIALWLKFLKDSR